MEYTLQDIEKAISQINNSIDIIKDLSKRIEELEKRAVPEYLSDEDIMNICKWSKRYTREYIRKNLYIANKIGTTLFVKTKDFYKHIELNKITTEKEIKELAVEKSLKLQRKGA